MGRKRQEGNRERVLQGAIGVVSQHGLRGLTVDRLAKRVGMSKSTLYAHFRNKEALLSAIVADSLEPFARALDQARQVDGKEAIVVILRGWRDFGDRLPPALLLDEGRLPAAAAEALVAATTDLDRSLGSALGRSGTLRPGDDAALVRIALGATALAVIRARAAGQSVGDLTTLAERLLA